MSHVPRRIASADRLRGLIIVLMALDHASYFIARIHPFEGWNAPPPWYGTVPELATRWVTHLSAPGFFLLMGASMVWLADSRRQQGWSEAAIRRFWLTRGAVLIVLQQLAENPAWLLGTLTAAGASPRVVMPPGGGSEVLVHLGVLNALGFAMILWALLITFPTSAIVMISLAALAGGTWMTPSPEDSATLFAPWLRLLFVPGHTDFINVMYPLIPWLAPAGLGIAVGRAAARQPAHVGTVAAVTGCAMVAAFVVMRSLGIGDPHAPAATVSDWLSVTKYPPTAAFLSITLGINLLLLGAFVRCDRVRALEWLATFGRSALFFYVMHLWLFAVASVAFPHGAPLPAAYVAWAVALGLLFPICQRFSRFKASKPAASLWRLF